MPLAPLCLAASAAAVLAASLPADVSGPVAAALAACVALLGLAAERPASARS